METLVRVTTPWFVAGAVFDVYGNRIDAAPILRKYNSHLPEFLLYCKKRGWEVQLIDKT